MLLEYFRNLTYEENYIAKTLSYVYVATNDNLL